MTMLGRPADEDPIDMSRLMARASLHKIITYSELALELLEDRDDDGAKLACRSVVAHTAAMKTAFNCLASAYNSAPAAAAHRNFTGAPTPVRQPEDDVA